MWIHSRLRATWRGVVGFAIGVVAISTGSVNGSARAQERRLEFFGDTTPGEQFGTSLCWLADRNGDGVDEILVGAPGANRVRVLSGIDLALLAEIVGEPGTAFGTRVVAITDLDNDGLEDLAIGAPDAADGSGRILLRSSATGAPLGELAPLPYGTALGTLFDAVGDVDGDGASEIAVATFYDIGRYGSELPPPLITLRSTRDGSQLATRIAPAGFTTSIVGLAALDDLDGDGVREIAALGLPREDEFDSRMGDPPPSCTIVSGRDLTNRLAFDVRDKYGRSKLPTRVAAIGDVDGDGWRDLALVRPGFVSKSDYYTPFDSELWVVSSASGATLRHFASEVEHFAGGVVDAGDLDGDGVPELALARHTLLDSGSLEVQFEVALLSLRSGAVLRRIAGRRVPLPSFPRKPQFGYALAGGRDLDQDGVPDLVIGDIGSEATSSDGGVLAWNLRDDALLAQRLGDDTQHRLQGGAVWCDDVDGDGIVDFAIGEVDWWSSGSVALRSGADGTLLRRITRTPLDDRFGLAIEPLRDLDGDGIGELAIGGRGVVEIRSPVDGGLVLALTEEFADEPVSDLACGAPDGGPIELLVGQPMAPDGARVPGRALLFDLSTGALLHRFDGVQHDERYGFALAWLGDVTGDGVSDWAIGAPNASGFYARAGRVQVINGALRKLVRQWFGLSVAAALGTDVAGVDDVDGDGFGELLLCEVAGGVDSGGRVRMMAGKRWHELLRVEGEAYERLGQRVVVVDDVNGDGTPELASTTNFHSGSRVRLHSLANGALLSTIGPARPTFGAVLASTRRDGGSRSGCGRPELAVVTPDDARPGAHDRVGSVEVWSLPSLFLELVPQSVAVGERVIGQVRGAPAGAFAGIYLEAIDAVPFEQFLDFGFCDTLGTFRDSSVVPPGMSGLCWSLRGYATGFDGTLVESSAEELQFE